MSGLHQSVMAGKTGQAGVQAIRYVFTGGMVAFLLLAWVLTAPLFRCGIWLGDYWRRPKVTTKN